MSNDNNDEYENICYICHRPESKAGKMLHLPENIDLCLDCLQNTFNTLNQVNANIDPSALDSFMNGGIFGAQLKKTTPENKEEAKTEISLEKTKNEDEEETETVKTKEEKYFDRANQTRIPNIRFINMADLGMPNRNKLKKKTKRPEGVPIIDPKKIPAPHKIKERLDEYVIGQEDAKKVMSVAVYNHYKRVAHDSISNDIDIEKSNMLMIGPTGSGKTYMVKTLAKLLDVPLAIADATSLTEAGYIGDDIESVVSKLLAAADNDVEKAEIGIIFIDEIDKIAKKKNTTSRDVSGESVQQGLLKLLEGANVEVPVGANSKNAMVPLATINTKNILFICGGAFPELEEVIKERLNKASSIGFGADLKDKYDDVNNLIRQVNIEDLRNFGMIPEFLGRLPVVFTLEGLTEDMLAEVLTKPKNAIIKQYQKLLEMDEVNLLFDDEAIHLIAKKALEKKTGARALRAIIEEFMTDIMYEVPKDINIGTVTITKDYIEHTGGPKIEMRTELPYGEKEPENDKIEATPVEVVADVQGVEVG